MISRLVKLKRRLRRKFSRTRWVARLLNRDLSAQHSDESGLVILQIDGLARTHPAEVPAYRRSAEQTLGREGGAAFLAEIESRAEELHPVARRLFGNWLELASHP